MKTFKTLLMSVLAFLAYGCASIAGKGELIEVAQFGESMAIGLSVNQEDRVFISFPNYDGAGSFAVAEVVDGKLFPYPDVAWNTKGIYQNHFLRVQDLYVDDNDFLWVLDSKPASSGNIFADGKGEEAGFFKLVKINTKTNQVEDTFFFDDLDKSKSALNDVRIDTEKNLAYLSDPASASIVVLDLFTKQSRNVLSQSVFTLADDIVLEYNGVKMQDHDGKPFSSNINSIALTHDFKYFYFKPINKPNLYRIETVYLANPQLTDQELQSKVEDLGEVGITHGMIADERGNIYFASSENFRISYVTPDGVLNMLVEDPKLIWPDSFGISSDGYLYFTCAQIQRLPHWNNGLDNTEYPYKAFKVKLP
ncbi:L-dopachrome tautomerase-related protein [Sphingobacterium corticibacter]|uniref:Gluconolactonase n=1 Tax=Sphingobacterium corticibacter TaxID=2171749 RepID=A0A2T8HIY6_9SPHI|nr:L-dopachrome tautomerase-related protein [Sphingobacterium corticibacter]PVH25404.1 gluconolactonase [Sphingobacterium corticibacter]